MIYILLTHASAKEFVLCNLHARPIEAKLYDETKPITANRIFDGIRAEVDSEKLKRHKQLLISQLSIGRLDEEERRERHKYDNTMRKGAYCASTSSINFYLATPDGKERMPAPNMVFARLKVDDGRSDDPPEFDDASPTVFTAILECLVMCTRVDSRVSRSGL